jgi:hypothetical protein
MLLRGRATVPLVLQRMVAVGAKGAESLAIRSQIVQQECVPDSSIDRFLPTQIWAK